jgi:hypothetical protein
MHLPQPRSKVLKRIPTSIPLNSASAPAQISVTLTSSTARRRRSTPTIGASIRGTGHAINGRKFHLYAQHVKCGAEKPRPGTTGASAALPACRSDRRMCIVGGRNDAADILQQFYLDCNLYLSVKHDYGHPVEQEEDEATVAPSGVTMTAVVATTKTSSQIAFRCRSEKVHRGGG